MNGPRFTTADRAVSKEGMAAIAFGLTILMIGITGGLLMQTGESLNDGGPVLTASAAPADASNGPEGQWLRIKHENGKTVAVSNLTINVTLPEHRKRASLHGLPTDELRQSDYDGNHVFTLGTGGVADAATVGGGDRQWAAGERLSVRFEERRVDLELGQTIQVKIRHTGEQRTLYSETVAVT